MFIGNLAALVQTNVKRMLAYSSIAHAGYILVAVAASTLPASPPCSFTSALRADEGGRVSRRHAPRQKGEKRLEIRDYAGLGQKQPLLAGVFSLFLLLCSGCPPPAASSANSSPFRPLLTSATPASSWLVVIAALNSVIGAYYYLRVIIEMYFSAPSRDYMQTAVAPALQPRLVLAATGTVYLGIFPARRLRLRQVRRRFPLLALTHWRSAARTSKR